MYNFLTTNKTLYYTIFCLVFVILAWLNSGTLSIYAAVLWSPGATNCGYLLNMDHLHFVATYDFLSGAEIEEGLLLRRILYPILSFPLMTFFKFTGVEDWFLYGGFTTNIFLMLSAFFLLFQHLRKNYGLQSATATSMVLLSYPGIYYWIGSPYSYNLIVPGSIACYLILHALYHQPEIKRFIILSLLMGILFLGYDYHMFFLPATFFILLYHLRFLRAFLFLFLSSLPLMLWLFTLEFFFEIPAKNSNTEIYGNIISGYFTISHYKNYAEILAQFPHILLHNFLFSNFLFLPLLGILTLGISISRRKIQIPKPAIFLFLTILLVHMFNNLAPLYESRWQLRGTWIARLYQPLFITFLIFIASNFKNITRSRFLILGIMLTALNFLVVIGPVLKIKEVGYIYKNFYWQISSDTIYQNTKMWGRRPLGFCINQKQVETIGNQQRREYKEFRKNNPHIKPY